MRDRRDQKIVNGSRWTGTRPREFARAPRANLLEWESFARHALGDRAATPP